MNSSRVVAAAILLLAGGLAAGARVYGDDLPANAADGMVDASSVVNTGHWAAEVGRNGTVRSFIIPFQLPTLGSGNGFNGADLRLNLYANSAVGYNADVYGLARVSDTSDFVVADFFLGASDETATLIQGDLFTPSSGTGITNTDDAGDTALTDWLNLQYNSGTNAGKFVFLRVNPDATPGAGVNYYNVLSQNAGGATERPLITYTEAVYDPPPPPEIGVIGLSGNEITNGDVSPSTPDGTDFGALDLHDNAISRTFTVTNSGSLALNLVGSPRVAVSGPQASDFTVTAQPAYTVPSNGVVTFTLRFLPLASGTRQATISIANNDADENPFTFAVQGTGVFNVAAYPYRAQVQFCGYGRDEKLTNFPALVVLGAAITNFSYGGFLDPSGGDLRFTDASQTRLLRHEVETWNTGGSSFVWVRVPELVGSTTTVWALWGNPAQTNAPAFTTNGETWAESYVGVWHLGETSGEFRDSTAQNPGTLVDTNASSTRATNSLIGQGIRFVGAEDDFIEIANEANFKLASDLTLLVWAKGLSGNAWAPWISKNGEATGYALRRRGAAAPAAPDWCTRGASNGEQNGPTIDATAWHFVAGTLSGGSTKTKRLFIDGAVAAEATNVTGSILDNSEKLHIGGRTNPAAYWGGVIDEVRVSSVARSTNWVWAEYLNSGSNSVFNLYGAVSGGPEIAVLGTNLAEIADGSGTPATADGTDFGPVTLATGGYRDRVFTITNSGNMTLVLAGSPIVTVGGAAAADYSVIAGPTLTNLAVGQTATFTVRFQPGATGARAATVSLGHNDVDENPYTFAVSGTGVFDPDIYASHLPLQFCGYGRDETLTNFPALVVLGTHITGFSYDQFLSATGGDLRFSDGAQTSLLNFEIESWDTNGSSYVWVQVPALNGTNTTIHAYWGNPAETTLPAYATNGATWAERYAGVWHLAETSGSTRDSTPNGLTGYPSNGVTQEADGQINGADYFSGTDSRTTFGTPAVLNNLTNNFTVSAWIRPDVLGGNRIIFGAHWASLNGWSLRLAGAQPAIERLGPTLVYNSGVSVTAAEWVAVSAAYDTDNDVTFFLNGDPVATVTGAAPASVATQPWSIGANAADYFNGMIDEVQVSQVVRSTNWIWAAYRNSSADGNFTCYGEVEGPEPPAGDSDGDGLPDEWELLYGLDPNSSNAPTSNADTDWMTDQEEYFADTNPTNTSSVFPLVTQSNAPFGTFVLVVNPSSTGRVYGVRWTTNLVVNPQVWTLYGAEKTGTGSAVTFSVTNDLPGRTYRTGVRLP
jgi:hypothetical protein